jgi:type I restriction enzyme R subunit
VSTFTESVVEEAALGWLESVGWGIANGPEIAPDMLTAERRDYGEVVLARRLRDALVRLNPALPGDALEDAFRKLTRPEGADLIQRNRALHRLLVDGVTVEYRDGEDGIRDAQARVIDFRPCPGPTRCQPIRWGRSIAQPRWARGGCSQWTTEFQPPPP